MRVAIYHKLALLIFPPALQTKKFRLFYYISWIEFFQLFVPTPAMAFDHGTFCKYVNSPIWYVAFGDTVLKIPINTFKQNYEANVERAPQSDWLKAPDQSAPLGCYGNPEQLRSLMVYYWPTLYNNSSGSDSESKIVFFQMYRHWDVPNTLDNPDSPAAISYSNTISCKFYKLKFSQTDGSLFCINSPSINMTKIPLDKDISWMFYSSINLYSTYKHEPLSMSLNNFEHLITVKYVFNKNILLQYKWSLSPNTKNFSDIYLIRLDKSVETQLGSYIVKDYPWQN